MGFHIGGWVGKQFHRVTGAAEKALKDTEKVAKKAADDTTQQAGRAVKNTLAEVLHGTGNVVGETFGTIGHLGPVGSVFGTLGRGIGSGIKGIGEVTRGGNADRIRNLPQDIGRGLVRNVMDPIGSMEAGGYLGKGAGVESESSFEPNQAQANEVAKENIKNTTGATINAFSSNKIRRNVGSFGFNSNISNNTNNKSAFGSDLSDYFGEV